MKYLSFFLVIVLFLIAGCSQQNPVGVESQDLSLMNDEIESVAKKMVKPLALIGKYQETWETIVPPDFEHGNPIGEVVIQGIGFVTQLGKSKLYIHEFINFGVYPNVLNADYISITSLEIGDKIEGTFEGLAEGDAEGNLNFWGTFHITGGTGEFAGVTGEAKAEGGGKTDLATGKGSGWVKFKGYLMMGDK